MRMGDGANLPVCRIFRRRIHRFFLRSGDAEFVQLSVFYKYHMQPTNPVHVFCMNISGTYSQIYSCT